MLTKHCDLAVKVLEVGYRETLSTNVSTLKVRLRKPIRSACLCEKTPLCLSSGGSNVRNDALEASFDTVKLQWDCVMPPRGCSTSWKPRGDHRSSVNFLKVMVVFHSSPFLPLKKGTGADGPLRILFFYLWTSVAHFQRCPWKRVLKGGPHSTAKTHTTRR